MKQKIAIIGGGMAGLTAAYLLNDRYDLTVFEKEPRVGGNAYTLQTRDGHRIDVSIFFFSSESYPNFFKLLEKLGLPVTTRPLTGASMTMKDLDTAATRCFNFDPADLLNLQRLNLKTAAINLSLAVNIHRALRLLEDGAFEGLTMAQALKLLPNLKGEASNLLLFPLCLMASMHYHELMKAPAIHFMGKLERHFGSLKKVVSWRLINHRTDDYLQALTKNYRDRIVLSAEIKSVARTGEGVTVRMRDGSESHFDHVVFACYADQALKMIEQPTDDEQRILGVWKYNDGLVVVHQDPARFPAPKLMSMYEYLYTDRDGTIETSINAAYRFQKGVADDCGHLGTQYPNFPIRDDLIEFQKVFRTPIYNNATLPVMKELPSLNGVRRSYFCGSHFGYGLHEDAVTSAIEAAKMLGAQWE